jgi:hypothetical protein
MILLICSSDTPDIDAIAISFLLVYSPNTIGYIFATVFGVLLILYADAEANKIRRTPNTAAKI